VIASRSKPDRGVVSVETTVWNQREEEWSKEPANLEVHPQIAAARVDYITAWVAVAPRASTES